MSGLVTIDNFHEIIPKFIKDNEIIISEYEDMQEVVLKMIREGFLFNFDKNLLRGFLEDLTYHYSPNDDKNKDRIVNMLEESDDEESSDDDDEGMQEMMMKMMMAAGGAKKSEEKVEEVEDVEAVEEVSEDVN